MRGEPTFNPTTSGFSSRMSWTSSRCCINRRRDSGSCRCGREPTFTKCQKHFVAASCAHVLASPVTSILGVFTREQTDHHKRFCIFLRCGTEQLCIPVSQCTTGFDVKCSVERRTGIAKDVLTLHAGIARMLDDFQTLDEQGITSGSSLDVCLALRGGGDNERRTRSPDNRSLGGSSHGIAARCRPALRNSSVSEDDVKAHGTEGLEEELHRMIASLGICCESMQSCTRTLVANGFESVQSLRDVSVEFLTKIGLLPGHAHCIVREARKWVLQYVLPRCQNGTSSTNLQFVKIKPISSLRQLRDSISNTYPDQRFVFISRTGEIDEDQEHELPICDFCDSQTFTMDLKFSRGSATSQGFSPRMNGREKLTSLSDHGSRDQSPLGERTEPPFDGDATSPAQLVVRTDVVCTAPTVSSLSADPRGLNENSAAMVVAPVCAHSRHEEQEEEDLVDTNSRADVPTEIGVDSGGNLSGIADQTVVSEQNIEVKTRDGREFSAEQAGRIVQVLGGNSCESAATRNDSKSGRGTNDYTVDVKGSASSASLPRTGRRRRRQRQRKNQSSVRPSATDEAMQLFSEKPSRSLTVTSDTSSSADHVSMLGSTPIATAIPSCHRESDVESIHSDSTDVRADYKDSGLQQREACYETVLYNTTDTLEQQGRSSDVPVLPESATSSDSESDCSSHLQAMIPPAASLPYCTRRKFGTNPLNLTYPMGSLLRKPEGADDVELEFCSLIGVPLPVLPWRMMEHAVPFIAACLNSRLKGTIAFGVVGREDRPNTEFSQVVGIPVKKNMLQLIEAAFASSLKYHIKTERFFKLPIQQKEFIKLYPIKVTHTSSRENSIVRTDRCVFEIDVDPRWEALGDQFFYYWWFSQDHRDLLGPKAYRVYQNKPLIDKDQENKMLVERRDGQTMKQDSTRAGFVAHEVKRKYRWFKQQSEKRNNSTLSDCPPDEAALVQLLRERLKALTTSIFDYVLIANDISLGQRTSRAPFLFDFVKLIPLIGVIDFDQNSETDGLYKCVTARHDDGIASLQPLPLHHDDCERHFTRSFHMFHKAQVLHAAGQLPWIFANGRENEFEKLDDSNTWFCERKGNIDFALRKMKEQYTHLVAMFLVFGDTSINEMAWLVDSVFTLFNLLQSQKSEKRLLILCDEQSTVDSLVKLCSVRHEVVRNHCVAGLPWTVVSQIITELTENFCSQVDGAKYLLTSSSVITEVPTKKLSEWRSIEVLDYHENKKKPLPDELVTVARDNFYRGEPVSWDNLKLNHDVKRDMTNKVKQCVRERLKARSGQVSEESLTKVTIPTTVVTILHRPGTGGSTLAKRVIWDLHQEECCRCAVIEGITDKTLQHLEELQRFGEKNSHGRGCLPLLLYWDGDDVDNFNNLVFQLSKRGVRSVCLEVKALSHPDMDDDEMLGEATFIVPSVLKDSEVIGLKQIVWQLEESQEKKNEILREVDRDRRLFYFGLHLFGKQYNQQRLMQYVNLRLNEMGHIEQQLLQFCSFVYIYGHMSIPRSSFKDTYLAASAEDVDHFSVKSCISSSCSDLLLEVQEKTENYGYYGWRPAHQLVAEIILHERNLVQTAIDFMSTMLQGQSFGRKYLAEVACELFCKRVYFHKGDEWYDEYDEIATDFYRDKQQQQHTKSSRYSLFITEIMSSDKYNADTVIALWFTLCTFVREKPYAWQHFARFLALDVRNMQVNPLLWYYTRELLARKIETHDYYSLQLIPTDDIRQGYLQGDDEFAEADLPAMDGFEVALKCIQEAHTLQPNVSAIYSTEGLVYQTKLECFACNLKERVSTDDVEKALTITNSAIEAFRKAQSCRQKYRNWHPLVGEIQIGIKMLQILKDWSAFEHRYYTSDGASFETYTSGELTELPESLSPHHDKLLKCLVQRILHVLHSVFQHESAMHADRSTEEPIQRRWRNAIIAASELQMQFYKTLSFKTEKIYANRARWEKNPKMREMLSDNILKDSHENPFSSWKCLNPRTMRKLIELLMPVVKERGHKVGCSTVVILIRACLEIDLDKRPPWRDIVELIHNSCIDFPQSEWAFMFRGMIHFPFPDDQHRFRAIPKVAIESFRDCEALTQKKPFQFKRARPRYFVGRSSDGYVFLPFSRVTHLEGAGSVEYHRTEGLYLNSPDWWRSHPAWTRLARLQGTRQDGRMINYQGIRIRMDKDHDRNSEGREKLWFCVGFTVQGPVAFDPLDEETYDSLCDAENNGEIRDFSKILEERKNERIHVQDNTREQRNERHAGTAVGTSRRTVTRAADESVSPTLPKKKTSVEHRTNAADHARKVRLGTTRNTTSDSKSRNLPVDRDMTPQDSETTHHADECESSREGATASLPGSVVASRKDGTGSPKSATTAPVGAPSQKPEQKQSSRQSKRRLIIVGIAGLSDEIVRKAAAKFGPFKLCRDKRESAVLVFESHEDATSALSGLPTAFEGRDIEVKWKK